MTHVPFRAALLAATALALPTLAHADPVAGPVAVPASEPITAAVPQSTSADQAGQANDKQSLTTSDIIVTGSRTAQAAPLTAKSVHGRCAIIKSKPSSIMSKTSP